MEGMREPWLDEARGSMQRSVNADPSSSFEDHEEARLFVSINHDAADLHCRSAAHAVT
jgi:hypothetical protein